jgi:acetyl-CoA acyltransferase
VGGGTENFSDLPIRAARNVRKRAVKLMTARTLGQRLRILSGLRPRDLLPELPSATDLTTGLNMGQACEAMARRFGVTREAADAYAVRSHQRAAAAWQDEQFGDDVIPVQAPDGSTVSRDEGVRADSSEPALARLKPAFDRQAGIITAGNASGLTDGAAALLLMSADTARQRGLTPLARVRDHVFTGVADMHTEMLMGPAVAIPRLLARNGLSQDDVDVYEVHEAFAAQFLANQAGLADPEYARREAGVQAPAGAIPLDKLNIWGGSLALGNPFAATGGRLLATAARRMRQSQARYGVIATCAGGGLGAAMLLENPELS